MTKNNRNKLNKFLVIMIILAMVIPTIVGALIMLFGG